MGFGQGSGVLVRPPFWALADASSRNETRKAMFLVAMTTATRVGELQALSLCVLSGRQSGSPLWPVFSGITESVSHPSQINHSLVYGRLVGDLPERFLCPVRTVCYLRWTDRSVEFTPSRLFVSPLDPTRILSKNAMSFFLRQFITESGAVSSWFHRNPWDPRDCSFFELYSIFPFLPSPRQLHGSLLWCPTDMSTTWSRPTAIGPLIAAGSAVHQHWVTGVCVSYLSPSTSMGLYLAFSLMSNFSSNPIQSYPSLTFSLSMDSTAPCNTVRVCFNRFLYFTIMVIHYLATCITRLLGRTWKCLPRTFK